MQCTHRMDTSSAIFRIFRMPLATVSVNGALPQWGAARSLRPIARSHSATASEVGALLLRAALAKPARRSCARWRNTGDRRFPTVRRRKEPRPRHPRLSRTQPLRSRRLIWKCSARFRGWPGAIAHGAQRTRLQFWFSDGCKCHRAAHWQCSKWHRSVRRQRSDHAGRGCIPVAFLMAAEFSKRGASGEPAQPGVFLEIERQLGHGCVWIATSHSRRERSTLGPDDLRSIAGIRFWQWRRCGAVRWIERCKFLGRSARQPHSLSGRHGSQ